MTEADLQDMYDFIAGEGKHAGWHLAGNGITTYYCDSKHPSAHQLCEELHRRGLVKIHYQDKEYVVWVKV